MRDMIPTGMARALTALQPFLQVVQELGPLSNDPEACDFLAGSPEEPALPGYVETLSEVGRARAPKVVRIRFRGSADTGGRRRPVRVAEPVSAASSKT